MFTLHMRQAREKPFGSRGRFANPNGTVELDGISYLVVNKLGIEEINHVQGDARAESKARTSLGRPKIYISN